MGGNNMEAVNKQSRFHFLKEVTNSILLQKFSLFVKDFIEEEGWYLRPEAVKSRGWEIVPVEKGRHLEPAEIAILVKGLVKHGYRKCYAPMFIEKIGDDPDCLEVPVTEEGLDEFSRKLAGINIPLISEDCSFILLFTSEEWNLYAGQKSFIEDVLGKTIKEARAEFDEFASDLYWEGRLEKLANRYKFL
jgi:hypothetical protein